MKRTNTALALITVVVAAMAITAGPAAALDKNATPVGSSGVTATPTGDSLAGQAAAAHQRANYQSVNAVVSDASAPDVTATAAGDSTGFDWGDALIGAGVALGLVLLSAATFHELRRHRRIAVGSRA